MIKGYLGAIIHCLILGCSKLSIVACSQSVQSYLLKFPVIKNKNIVAICNGVDQDIFYPLSIEEKIENRKKLDFKEHSKIYIYCGKLIRRKRVPELIQLFLDKTNHPNNILLIIGDGPEMDDCLNLAKYHKNIQILGFISNPVPYYQIADYIVSYSSAEGYPMSIIEGVSSGCRAFISTIPSHNELIRKYPEYVFP